MIKGIDRSIYYVKIDSQSLKELAESIKEMNV